MSQSTLAPSGDPSLLVRTNETTPLTVQNPGPIVIRTSETVPATAVSGVTITTTVSPRPEEPVSEHHRLGIYHVLVVHTITHDIRDVRVIAPDTERAKLLACAELQLRPDDIEHHAFIVRELGTFVSRRLPAPTKD